MPLWERCGGLRYQILIAHSALAFQGTARGDRFVSTAIYFLLRGADTSRWHCIHGREELWHWCVTVSVTADWL